MGYPMPFEKEGNEQYIQVVPELEFIKGDKGDQGEVGPSPNLTIGTVETLEPHEKAQVTLTGTQLNPVLNFKLPKGPKPSSTVKEITITASQWKNGVFTLNDPLVTSTTCNQEFLLPITDDEEMIRRIHLAALEDAGQGVGWLKLKCKGTVPSDTIKLRVIFRGEI